MSSHRSEAVKGFVTRDGARIIKGDVKLRLPILIPPRGMPAYPVTLSSEPSSPEIVLIQITAARTLINSCLDVVDVTRWAGDKHDASFIAGQLRLLDVNLQEAKAALKIGTGAQLPWYKAVLDDTVCFLILQSTKLTRTDIQPANCTKCIHLLYHIRGRHCSRNPCP
jgi:hypothetical protein